MADIEPTTQDSNDVPAQEGGGEAINSDIANDHDIGAVNAESAASLMLGTYALFQVASDWYKSLWVNITGVNMDGNIPSNIELGPALPAPEPPLQLHPNLTGGQSWVELGFRASEMGINIGRGLYDAGLKYLRGPAGQAELVMAPVDPGDLKGWDFFIWVLAGPGKLQSIVQSVIDANFDAMKPYLKRKWVEVNIPPLGDFALTEIRPKKLQCTYAAVSKQGRTSSWILNLVVDFTGEAYGTLNGKAISQDFEDLKCHANVIINTKDPNKTKISVNRLQMSLKAGLGPGNYYIPGIVNTTYNSKAITAINGELEKLNLKDVGSLEKYNVQDYIKPPPFGGRYAQWMSKPNIQAKKLFELKIPATHDSAAYVLEKTLSEMIYSDQEFLKNLRPGKAPSGQDSEETLYYIGNDAYDYVMEQVMWLALAHDSARDVKKQLEEGVRFFDIRLYHDSRLDDYYTHHTLRGPKLNDIFNQIQQYISTNTSSQEFAIFELSHDNFNSVHAEKVANMVREQFGSSIYTPTEYSPDKRYNFQNLTNLQLSSITNGKLKLLFVNTGSATYPHSVVNTDGGSLFPDPGDGQKPGDGIFGRYFTVTPSTTDCAGYVMINAHHPTGKIKALQRFSRKKNNEVKKALEDPRVTRFMMDWYTEADKELPIDLIVKANG